MLKVTLDKLLLNRTLLILDSEFPYVRNWVNHLIKYRGIPGFVYEFKTLKSWALQLLSGNREYKVDWFATDCFLGCRIPRKYKQLFQLIVCEMVKNDKLSHRKIRKYLSVLNIFHCAFGPSESDLRLQIQSALQKPVYPRNHGQYLKMVRLACMAIRVDLHTQEGQLTPTGQTVALTPGVNGSWGKFCVDIILNKLGRDYLASVFQEDLRVEGGSFPSQFVSKLFWDTGGRVESALKLGDYTWMGNLTPIGESGGKTRLVMVGNPLVQSKLTPLKRKLLLLLDKIPTDCTFRQEEGRKWVQELTKSGSKIYSVDLKDCTWNFPSSLQEEILTMCGVDRKIRDYLFRTKVYNQLTQDSRLIEKGQAMGLGPSFPLFSLLHNLILWFFCMARSLNPVKTFRVLGDDVVISDKGVYHLYRKFLHDYEVPVSVQKTFISEDLAEFAGTVFYKGHNITPIKWRYLTWESLSSLYWTYSDVFGSNQAKKLIRSGKDHFSLLVLSPIPRKLGGLGIVNRGVRETGRVISIRKGILESILTRGKEGSACGFPKLKQHLFQASLFKEHQFSRDLYSRFMEVTNFLDTEYGELPKLCPNPFNFLKQVGKDLKGLPIREIYKPEIRMKFRFRRSKSTESWKSLLGSAMIQYEEEQRNVKCNHEENIRQAVQDSETELIRYWFTREISKL